MNDKIEELMKKNNSIDTTGTIRPMLKEAILYGRASALDEVEQGLPEPMHEVGINPEGLRRKQIYNGCFEEVRNIISRIRSETSGYQSN